MSNHINTDSRLQEYLAAHSLDTGIPISILLQDTNFRANCELIIEQLATADIEETA